MHVLKISTNADPLWGQLFQLFSIVRAISSEIAYTQIGNK
jgi:hypothetical protein